MKKTALAMLKIGVLGVGHLGKVHVRCLQMLSDKYEIVGFFDPNDEQAQQVAGEFSLQRFTDLDALLEAVEVVDIVTPTTTHFALAKMALERGKHVFIEKPVTESIEEAEALLKLIKANDLKVQVGHVERFNPALLSLGDLPIQPMFVEGHRLSNFNPRGTDVSVVLDLMIHDLDLLLNLVQSEVVEVSASGVAVVSKTPDICNAHIEFANGCVANLTASRISLKQMRKIRLFQPDAYISLDFLEKEAQIVRLSDEPHPEVEGKMSFELPVADGARYMQIENPEIQPVNAIKMELSTLADSIVQNSRPRVSLEDGYRALKLAHQISDKMEQRLRQYAG